MPGRRVVERLTGSGDAQAAVAADRDPRAEPVGLYVDESGFSAWARGAATIAIQDAVDRIDLDQNDRELLPAAVPTGGAVA